MRRLIISFSFVFISLLLLASSCSAGWFSKEKEVKDEYLTKLFEPNIPYESIKVVEGSKEIRFIVIKTKEKISSKMMNEYNDLLLSRGVNIYGTFHYGVFSWQKTVTDFAITITRKVEGEPDTIEISESVVKDPIKKEPIVAASAKGKEIRIAIEKDFGKKWKKIKLIPDKEPDGPEPKIGRYRGSKLIKISSHGSGKEFKYVSKDSLKNVSFSLYNKIQEKYKDNASSLPEGEESIINNPHFKLPIKPFGIKSIGKVINIDGFNPITENNTPNRTEIKIIQSIDINLSEYIQIEIEER